MQGFYLENKENKEEMANEDLEHYEEFIFMEDLFIDDNTSLDAFQFLHGNCDYFAIELNKKFGYDIVVYYTHDYLIHAYCKKEDYLIDVRGITTNEKHFWEEFMEDIEDDSITKEELKFSCYQDFFEFLENLEYGSIKDENLSKLSKTIIENYFSYYAA